MPTPTHQGEVTSSRIPSTYVNNITMPAVTSSCRLTIANTCSHAHSNVHTRANVYNRGVERAYI